MQYFTLLFFLCHALLPVDSFSHSKIPYGYMRSYQRIINSLIYFWIYKCCGDGGEYDIVSSDGNILISFSGPIVVENLTTSLRLFTVILPCYLLLIDRYTFFPFHHISFFETKYATSANVKIIWKLAATFLLESNSMMILVESPAGG